MIAERATRPLLDLIVKDNSVKCGADLEGKGERVQPPIINLDCNSAPDGFASSGVQSKS